MIIPEKISLANIPTPLFEMKFGGRKFLMKRDDFTGLELSGNKVRKLEYLLARAKKVKASMIYTCGGEQSNHSRATAVAARSMGFDVRLFLWGQDRRNPEGNLFIDKFMKCNLEFLNKKDFLRVRSVMEEYKAEKEEKNRKVFIIPEGGS
ncbi:MAG: pyridoxal-phosphate dependent enzyme, partial [Syntrophothermus sp.]